ncbi:hypothetical protein ACIPPS_14120 [Streptomyces sp. NPDC090127]|uniref:hypothetical protein n=1 Tax=Streptomyces sp. NPDC090127 TaxID=3365953 RepID=UPI00381BFF88
MIQKNATTAAALVGGYLLGRTKKAKMAIGVGMFLAGRKLDLDPRRIGKLLANSPVTGALSDQVRRELVDATKSAATQALTKRATGLADTLHQRTQAIGRDGEAVAADDDERDDEATGSHDDSDSESDDGADSDSDSDKRKAPARSAGAAKSASKSASKTASKSTAKAGTAARPRKSTTARKRAAAPRKSAASRTRKSRSDNDE